MAQSESEINRSREPTRQSARRTIVSTEELDSIIIYLISMCAMLMIWNSSLIFSLSLLAAYDLAASEEVLSAIYKAEAEVQSPINLIDSK